MDLTETKGTIHGLALTKLAKQQKIARVWKTFPDEFDGMAWQRCYICDFAVWQISYLGLHNVKSFYQYTNDEKLALKVAHIAQKHPEVFDGIE